MILEGPMQFQDLFGDDNVGDVVPAALEVAFLDFRVLEWHFVHNLFVLAQHFCLQRCGGTSHSQDS